MVVQQHNYVCWAENSDKGSLLIFPQFQVLLNLMCDLNFSSSLLHVDLQGMRDWRDAVL
jgi:hypothetical protein